MKKDKSLSNDYFLNRLALKYQCNPADLRLRSVLREIYQFAWPEDYIEMLDAFFTAAMDSDSIWEEGKRPNAGNSVFVIEQIEIIMEACYLLHEKYKKNATDKKYKRLDDQLVIPAHLPLLIRENECRQPALVLSSFFEYLPLPEWKNLLHEFAINALSYSSVTDVIDQKHLFRFTNHLRKLVWAGFLLSVKP